MSKENKIILVVAVLIIVVITILGFVSSNNSDSNTNSTSTIKYDEFAKCLTDKGAVMYGAVWCTHCKEQKSVFGDSFRFINYVECPDNTKLCLDKGILGYPTWIFGTSTKRVEGFEKDKTMKELSDATGCLLPQ